MDVRFFERVFKFDRFFRVRGTFKGDGRFYSSFAHTEEDIAKTLDTFASALD